MSALQEQLRPHFERIRQTIIGRRDAVPQDPNSTTVRVLNTGWVSTETQTVDKKGKLVKFVSIGDKLVEEGAEVAKATERKNIVEESSQALYYMVVGCVIMDLTPGVLFAAIDQAIVEQETAVVPPDKMSQYAGAAVSRVALAGTIGNRDLVKIRTAEAVVAMSRVWETNGISPTEVGKVI